MINFAALTPHPPIIIPEIGDDQIKKVKKTILAMKKLAKEFNNSDPDTVIIISPHGLVYPDRFNICAMPKLTGSFLQFGAGNLQFNLKNDIELANEIAKTSKDNGINTLLYDNDEAYYELDHGTLVPIHFLLGEQKETKVLPITYSMLDKSTHLAFGEVIAEIAQKSKKRIAIIASGDLSHRLIQTAPAGYTEAGKEFDKSLLNHLKNKDTEAVLEMDEDFIEEAGECGYKSILVLLGVINKLNYSPKIMSYEGPFGVGYGIVNFQLKNEHK